MLVFSSTGERIDSNEMTQIKTSIMRNRNMFIFKAVTHNELSHISLNLKGYNHKILIIGSQTFVF
jgi:hypothetical protein